MNLNHRAVLIDGIYGRLARCPLRNELQRLFIVYELTRILSN